MAQFSITTTAEQDAAVKYAADQYNASAKDTLTAVQYARMRIDHLLNGLVDQWNSEARLTKADAYRRATPDDQATIDAILAKYSG